MALPFRGRHKAKMDAKGRISIPAPFRAVLEAGDPDRPEGTNATIHICYGDEDEAFLSCFTQKRLEEIDARISDMEDGHPDRMALEEYFLEYCEPLTLDDHGRLILTKTIRESKALGGETVFAGRGDYFRVFNAEAPLAAVSAVARAREKMAPGASMLSLLPSKKPAASTDP